MNEFLDSSDIIDWRHPDIVALARELAAGDPVETARRCFVWVRDEVQQLGLPAQSRDVSRL